MWAKFDDRFPRHPRVQGCSINAKWLFVVGTCHAGEFLSDGFVPASAVPGFVPELSKSKRDAAVRELVTAGLWMEVAGGFQIRNFLTYNPSRHEVERERAETKKRVADLRARRARNGSSNATGNALTNPVSNPSPAPAPAPEPTRLNGSGSSASLSVLAGGMQGGKQLARKDESGCRRWLEDHGVPVGERDAILQETRRRAEAKAKGPLRSLDAFALKQPDEDHYHLLQEITEQHRQAALDRFDRDPSDQHAMRLVRAWAHVNDEVDMSEAQRESRREQVRELLERGARANRERLNG